MLVKHLFSENGKLYADGVLIESGSLMAVLVVPEGVQLRSGDICTEGRSVDTEPAPSQERDHHRSECRARIQSKE